MRNLLVTIALLVLVSPTEADKRPLDTVRKITLRTVGQPKGAMNKPTLISSAQQLGEIAALKESAEKIKSEVDFSTEKLVYFAWTGDRRDFIAVSIEKDKKGKPFVVFTLFPGRTNQLIGHEDLYVIHKSVNFITRPAP